MLPKVLRTLQISTKPNDDGEPDPDFPVGSEESLSQVEQDRMGMPMPALFHDIMKAEWESPAKPKSTPSVFHKFYSLVPAADRKVKLPTVDDPVNSLVSSSVLPMDA